MRGETREHPHRVKVELATGGLVYFDPEDMHSIAAACRAVIECGRGELGEDLGGARPLDLVADNLAAVPLPILRRALVILGEVRP